MVEERLVSEVNCGPFILSELLYMLRYILAIGLP
jgi:hypothetical protein